MNETSIREAKSNLTRLLREVEKGRAVRLTRRGKPAAVLLSERQYERPTTAQDPDRNFLRFLTGWRREVIADDGKLVIATSGIRGLVSWGGDNHRMVLARLVPSGSAPGLIGIKAVDPGPRAGDGRIPILIRRSGGSQGVVSVDYSTAGGPSGQGFVPVSGTLVWGDGDRADKLIVIDPPQGFTLSVANPTGGALLAMSEIQVLTSEIPGPTQTTTNPAPGGAAVISSNNTAGGGGGATSWQVVLLLALGLLRLALGRALTARSRT